MVAKEIIKRFKNLTIVCSCDAIETLGTYMRYPLGWSEFEQNVKFVSEHANFLHTTTAETYTNMPLRNIKDF